MHVACNSLHHSLGPSDCVSPSLLSHLPCSAPSLQQRERMSRRLLLDKPGHILGLNWPSMTVTKPWKPASSKTQGLSRVSETFLIDTIEKPDVTMSSCTNTIDESQKVIIVCTELIANALQELWNFSLLSKKLLLNFWGEVIFRNITVEHTWIGGGLQYSHLY